LPPRSLSLRWAYIPGAALAAAALGRIALENDGRRNAPAVEVPVLNLHPLGGHGELVEAADGSAGRCRSRRDVPDWLSVPEGAADDSDPGAGAG
jgi:hypothetical protein